MISFEQQLQKKISLLEEHESHSLILLDKLIDKDYKWNYDIESGDFKKMAAIYLNINSSGELNLFEDPTLGNWGNASDQLPILSQLLNNKNLIVDLKPFRSDDECFTKYGVTPKQLLFLAENKYISLNLYAYDSEKPKGFENYKKYQQKVLLDLIDPNYSQCRINSIRRDALLKRISSSSNIYVNNQANRLYVENSMIDIPEKYFKQIEGLRSNSKSAAIETAVKHYNYCKNLITEYERKDPDLYVEINNIIEEIENGFNNRKNIAGTLLKLRGLKTCLGGPIINAMGGVYNMSSSAYGTLYQTMEREGVDKQNFEPIDIVTEEFLAYIQSLRTNVDRNDLKMRPLTDEEFKDYLRFIKDITYKRDELLKTLSNLKDLKSHSTYDLLIEGKNYFEIENYIMDSIPKVIKKIPGIIDILSIVLVGIPGSSLGLGNYNVISLCRGAVMYGAKKIFAPDNLINGESRRVLQHLNTMRSLTLNDTKNPLSN